MRGTPIYVGYNLSGGLNTRDSSFDVAFTEARDLANVIGTANGGVTRRNGNTTFATTAAQLTSLGAIEVVGPCLIGQAGSAFYKVDTSGVVTTVTGATAPSAANWAFAQAPASGGQGPVYAMNGTTTPQQWTGAGNFADWTASAGTLPNGKFMVYAGNRIFVAGMSTYASAKDPAATVAWCAAGDARDWSTAVGHGGFVELDSSDGDQITGLGVFGSYVLAFKRRKVFVIYDLDSGANRRLSSEIGCVAPRSIAESPQGTFFLTLDRGVWTTDGRSVKYASDVISPTVAGITASARANAAGAYFANHYYLSCALTGNANDTILDFDTVLNSWWKHTVGSNVLAVWRPLNAAGLYSAAMGARVDQCFVANTTTDNGVGFSSQWTSGWLAPVYYHRRLVQAPEYRHRLRQVRFSASGELTLSYSVDFVSGLSKVSDYVLDTNTTLFGGVDTYGGGGTFGDSSTATQCRGYNLGVANAFSLQFGSDTANPVTGSGMKAWQLNNYMLLTGDRND